MGSYRDMLRRHDESWAQYEQATRGAGLVTRTHVEMFMRSTAIYSPCERYRLMLSRTWDADGDRPSYVNWLMLNPSTATEERNDPTLERCQRRTQEMGFGSMWITNLFALRATLPRTLLGVADPIHALNDAHIVRAAERSSMVVCGWGSKSFLKSLVDPRAAAVVAMLRARGVTLHALRLCDDGQPGHPLYVSYETKPTEWKE